MEDFIFYDSRKSKNMRRKRTQLPDMREVLTISPLTNRLYLSVGLYQRFDLGNNRLAIVQARKDKKKLWIYIDNEHGFEPQDYRWCYYINCKEAVQSITDSYEVETNKAFEFIVSPQEEMIAGKRCYRLVLGKLEKEGASKKKSSYDLDQFEQDDFPGRIKTREIIRAQNQIKVYSRI